MDSGNSGSLQSSSGGDEEYDSRADSISILFNNPLTHVTPVANSPPQNHHPHPSISTSPSMFDPFTNPNSLLNLDWSKNLRSDTNPPDLSGFIRPTFPSLQIPPGPGFGPGSGSGSGSGLNVDQSSNNKGSNNVKNPKKRSRASRRAPTTVLTTDTTNFRAMVQEFTGIPAPPFSSSSFPRSRLDLFGNSATFRSHLLRPFSHKIQPNNATTSSMVDALVSTTNVNSSDHLDLFNPILNFHPIFQPPPKFPLPNSAFLAGGSPMNANLLGVQSFSSSLDQTSALVRRGKNNWGGDQGVVLRSINGGNYDGSQRVADANNVRVNFSASDFHGDKGPQNVATRTEGMLESWICSSD